MACVNKVTLVGSLASGPVLEYPVPGEAHCRLEVVTKQLYRDASGQRREHRVCHPVVLSGRRAEACVRELVKGRFVLVQGRLQTHIWADEEGRQHWSADILAARIVPLGPNLAKDEATARGQRPPRGVGEGAAPVAEQPAGREGQLSAAERAVEAADGSE